MLSTRTRLWGCLGSLVLWAGGLDAADETARGAEGFKTLPEFQVQRGDITAELGKTGAVPTDRLADLLVAEQVEALTGIYGVHFPWVGRDIHAVTPGPDGRLYFFCANGDALAPRPAEKGLELPEEGAVLRCEPDGSHLEIFCRGLRDPHGLAFDNVGNLFAVDAGSGEGDHGRWLYLMEHGDYGWRLGWLRSALPPNLVPWMSDELWATRFIAPENRFEIGRSMRNDYRAAWVLPPVAGVPAGSWGVAHYPGTGFGGRYNDHFFVSDPMQQAIHFCSMRANGAEFILLDRQDACSGAPVRELAFLPGARLAFVTRDEQSKEQPGFYVLSPSSPVPDVQVDEATRLLGGELKQKAPIEWQGLLKHPDQRVRLAAEWSLTSVPDGEVFLREAALSPNGGPQPSVARLHGIWGLGIVARRAEETTPGSGAKIVEPLVPLLEDEDLEVQAQAVQVLGELRVPAAFDGLIRALRNPEERVSMFAAQALAKFGNHEALPQLMLMLQEGGDHDPNLRHAYVEALLGLHDFGAIEEAARNNAPGVRMAALLAMRQLRRGEITMFLQDEDPTVVNEAKRAVHDLNIPAGLPPLAALLAQPDELLLPRILNANFRLGGAANALALADFATWEVATEALRVEALHLLAEWAKPAKFDYVTGEPQDLEARNPGPARAALEAVKAKLDAAREPAIVAALAEARRALGK